jgi:hypothetical protein
MFKLAVVGSRTWKDWLTVRREINKLKPDEIVSGGAQGVDRMAKDVADRDNFCYIEFLPNWNKYGKRAGAVRNKQIVDYCDKLIAFWDGKSKGTKISIDMAEKAGKLLNVYYETL